jgi:hypothetical protein
MQEMISSPGLENVDNDESNEFVVMFILIQFNERYKSLHIPFMIT